jgi:hypothetical protein
MALIKATTLLAVAAISTGGVAVQALQPYLDRYTVAICTTAAAALPQNIHQTFSAIRPR